MKKSFKQVSEKVIYFDYFYHMMKTSKCVIGMHLIDIKTSS